jgi:hypothetical protein
MPFSSIIVAVFDFLTEIPVLIDVRFNFWFVVLVVTTPLLVFFVDVERSFSSHVVRVFGAIALTYVLFNLSLHTGRALDWADYVDCQENSVHRYESTEMFEECSHHVNTADGAANVFYLYFAWIPAIGYASLWEIIWRIRHRKKLQRMGKDYKGRWFSNTVMAFVVFPVVSYFFFWVPFYIWGLFTGRLV